MASALNAMDILRILPKTNCRGCRELTCLVFAVSVFQGRKKLSECPYVTKEVIELFGSKEPDSRDASNELQESINDLKRKVSSMDYPDAAYRTGAEYVNDTLIVKVFGKDFRIDKEVNLSSDIHMHPWIVIPILNYLLNCSGSALTGKWTPMRELRDGMAWNGLFEQRCEKPLKKIIDEHKDFFEIMAHIFNAREVDNDFGSDISIVLTPLVKLPILIRYWKPDGRFESNVNIFFDSSAQDNLDLDSAYALAAGLVRMFEKIAETHGEVR